MAFLCDKQPDAGTLHDDLLRTALVMGMGALDSLMHFVVYHSIENGSSELSPGIRELQIRFGDLAGLADKARQKQSSGQTWKPWVDAKWIAFEALLKKTFQSYGEVGAAMKMAGIDDGWGRVAKLLGEERSTIEARLGALAHRRNQIVHELDRERKVRPRDIRLQSIDRALVLDDLEWLGRLTDAIAAIVGW